jgi:hypothetical protein
MDYTLFSEDSFLKKWDWIFEDGDVFCGALSYYGM